MKVYEVTDNMSTNRAGNMSNDEMLQKAKTVKAKIDKAEATGDADLLFSTGADLGELLMNNLMPKMLKFTDIMLIRMEKVARKNPENPAWQQFMKELGPLRAKIAQQKKQLVKQGVPLGRQDVGEDAPTMTGKQAALKAQQKAALLKSKTTDSGMVDKMNIVGKGMQDRVNKAQSNADSLSKAAGIDPNQVNKDIKKSLSGGPKLRDKFRKPQNVGETATSGATSAGAVAAVPGNGFANGGPGTLTRAGTIPNKKQKKNKKKN